MRGEIRMRGQQECIPILHEQLYAGKQLNTKEYVKEETCMGSSQGVLMQARKLAIRYVGFQET